MSDQANELMIETTAGDTVSIEVNRNGSDSSRAIIETRNLTVSYGQEQALRSVNLGILSRRDTAIIGPSGCGKSTFLRSINRVNDLVDSATIEDKSS